MNPICLRGECSFFWLKLQNLRIGVSYEAQTCFGTHFGPFRPFLDRVIYRKVFSPKSTACRNFWRKNADFGTNWSHFCLFGPKDFWVPNLVRGRQTPSNGTRNRYVAFWYTSNSPDSRKSKYSKLLPPRTSFWGNGKTLGPVLWKRSKFLHSEKI